MKSNSIIKEKILNEVGKTITQRKSPSPPSPSLEPLIFPKLEEGKEVVFAEKFTQNGGDFIYCASQEDFIETFYLVAKQNQWKQVICHEERVKEILSATQIPFSEKEEIAPENSTYITTCEAMVARHGSIILSSAQPLSQKTLARAHTHVIFALSHQIHQELQQALDAITQKYREETPSGITIITGKSKNTTPAVNDIPGTTGAKSVLLFFIEMG
ncbi:MAG: hypothetical protein CSA95_07145 [Bacteroidetes bacterium]|nr:MAG: hypothetical protein CSA95_07145 [Bacteroidota bacterium]PIE88046.1 MAG: hypothetical protein CSA04_03880 [Bacteroidota bacterium]